MSEIKFDKGKLVGRGNRARIYKINGDPHHFARKEFSLIHPVKLWNWFFYHSPHPFITDAGHKYSYLKRKVAHRLCEYIDSNVRIPDALHLSHKGFTTRFIEDRRPTKRERQAFRSIIRRLEDFFAGIGMPTWSFSRKNPFSKSNFLLKDNIIFVVDYEQSVPMPDSKGMIDYDTIYFDDVYNFIIGKKQRILDVLGKEETKHLDEAFEMTKKCHSQLDIRPKKITKVVNLIKNKRKGRTWRRY